MKKNVLRSLVVVLCLVAGGYADDISFQRIRVPDAKGRQVKATLRFSDRNKAIEIRPVKGDAVTIPYNEIDRCAYEYTKRHAITARNIATAPLGIGAVRMITKSKSHWLQIDYTEQNIRKTYVLRMDKHNYLRILNAVQTHTGKDPEVLGNANKRKK